MTNSSESLHASPRYDLEILFDVLYVLVEGSKPVSQDYLVDKTGVHNVKLKKYLEKYSSRCI